jgi:hypothetical protein
MSVPTNSLTIKEWFVFAEHLATNHTLIGHSPTERHYVRSEFVDLQGAAFSDLHSPALIAEAPDSEGLDAASNNLLARRYLAWTIVKQLDGSDNPNARLDAELECETLAQHVLARLRAERIHRGGNVFADVLMDQWEGSVMTPFLKAGWAGYRIMVPVLVNDQRLKHDPANWDDQVGAPLLLRDVSGLSCPNLNHPTLGLTQEQRLQCVLPQYDFSEDDTFNALTDQQEDDLAERLGGGGPCAPATVNRDGTFFGTVASGGTINVPSDCPAPTPTTVNGTESDTPTITVLQGGVQVGTLNPATGVHTVPECEEPPPCEDLVITVGRAELETVPDPCGQTVAISVLDSEGTNIDNITLNGLDIIIGDLPCAPCEDASVSINGDAFDSIPSGDALDIAVVNTDADPVGIVDPGVKVVIGDAQVQLQDTDDNPIGLPVDIAAESTGNVITAPNATVTIRNSLGADLNTSQILSGGTLDASVPDGLVQIKDSAGNNIGSPVSAPSIATVNATAPDGSVTIQNSVPTTLHTVAVRSNGTATQAIADSTITRPDGTTAGLPATTPLDVRTYRSGIMYNFGYILASGQTTSYRTGDEGSYRSAGFFNYTRPVYPLAYAALDNGTWATLASNNIHGNTLRFTNRSGGAAATSGNRVIQDHWTGLEWYIPSSLPAATTWNAAIDAAEASTVESSTDWMIPTDRMLDTISRDDQANPLNISPFNLGTTLEFWTSTTDPSDTTQARRCVNAAGGGLFGRAAKGANNGSYIFCRKFI